MLDSSEGTFDLRYQETEDQEDVLVFEKIRKEKRLLQEHLNKYTISTQSKLLETNYLEAWRTSLVSR